MLITLICILLLAQAIILAVKIILRLSRPVIYMIGGFAALLLIINLLPICVMLRLLLPVFIAVVNCIVIAAVL